MGRGDRQRRVLAEIDEIIDRFGHYRVGGLGRSRRILRQANSRQVHEQLIRAGRLPINGVASDLKNFSSSKVAEMNPPTLYARARGT